MAKPHSDDLRQKVMQAVIAAAKVVRTLGVRLSPDAACVAGGDARTHAMS
ncbi:hypothetical protein [[Phormidium] sp. ETS-05]|nr:hypothetical protein [[Phormidium] sp. ETS-05]